MTLNCNYKRNFKKLELFPIHKKAPKQKLKLKNTENIAIRVKSGRNNTNLFLMMKQQAVTIISYVHCVTVYTYTVCVGKSWRFSEEFSFICLKPRRRFILSRK